MCNWTYFEALIQILQERGENRKGGTFEGLHAQNAAECDKKLSKLMFAAAYALMELDAYVALRTEKP